MEKTAKYVKNAQLEKMREIIIDKKYCIGLGKLLYDIRNILEIKLIESYIYFNISRCSLYKFENGQFGISQKFIKYLNLLLEKFIKYSSDIQSVAINSSALSAENISLAEIDLDLNEHNYIDIQNNFLKEQTLIISIKSCCQRLLLYDNDLFKFKSFLKKCNFNFNI
jgi:hypothetical protein